MYYIWLNHIYNLTLQDGETKTSQIEHAQCHTVKKGEANI